MLRKRLNENADRDELRLSFDSTSKDWYVDDDRIDYIEDTIENLRNDCDNYLEVIEKQISKLEEQRNKVSEELSALENAEPAMDGIEDDDEHAGEWEAWDIWNAEFLDKDSELKELESKIESLEATSDYLVDVVDLLDD